MKFPKNKIILPDDLRGAYNGQLRPDQLIPIHGGGSLHWLAAWYFVSMQQRARQDGYELTYTHGGTYRSFVQQHNLFMQRFEPGFKVGRTNRFYQGKWWTLRKGMAMAATPGTSNHGLGLSIDVALGTHPNEARSLTKDAINWLLYVAPHFGFTWDAGSSEPWHISFYQGKVIPMPN